MQYVFHEPSDYGFRDRDGHDGKFFGADSAFSQHMIIEYDEKQIVTQGDLFVIAPGTRCSFGGKLKMLLINTPKWTAEQEIVS